jgi:hypothetical protein
MACFDLPGRVCSFNAAGSSVRPMEFLKAAFFFRIKIRLEGYGPS